MGQTTTPPATSRPKPGPLTTVGTDARPYFGVTLVSDGSCLTTEHYADLHEHFPGICTRITNYLRLEDIPGILNQVNPVRRQSVIIFAGTRDVFGAPELHYRELERPDRQLVSYSHQTISRGLRVLNRASSTPADRTYLCTVPHRAPFTPTTDRLYLNAVNLFQSSAFNIIHTANFDVVQHQQFFEPRTGRPTTLGRDYFIRQIWKTISGAR